MKSSLKSALKYFTVLCVSQLNTKYSKLKYTYLLERVLEHFFCVLFQPSRSGGHQVEQRLDARFRALGQYKQRKVQSQGTASSAQL